MNPRIQALGRLKKGKRNRTEAAYEAFLLSKAYAREIAWFRFEGIRLRLADNTHYTPDFAVMRNDGVMELHDVKGSKAVFTDDARVKIKVAAVQFPFVLKAVYPKTKRDGGGWEVEEF
jgi:hypothetical protein